MGALSLTITAGPASAHGDQPVHGHAIDCPKDYRSDGTIRECVMDPIGDGSVQFRFTNRRHEAGFAYGRPYLYGRTTGSTGKLLWGSWNMLCLKLTPDAGGADEWLTLSIGAGAPNYNAPSDSYGAYITLDDYTPEYFFGISYPGSGSTVGYCAAEDPGGLPPPPPLTYDQAEQEGSCSRSLEVIDGKWYADFELKVANPPPAGPYFPGVGPFAEDFVSFDAPWSPPTFDDDLYRLRVELPPVSEQPADGWLPRFHLRRRLVEQRGFADPRSHEQDYLVDEANGDRFDHSEELTLTCALVVDLTDPNRGATGPLGSFLPDEEQTRENLLKQLRECIPKGWAILNPRAYVEATGCLFDLLFVPKEVMAWEQLRVEADQTVLADTTTLVLSLNETAARIRSDVAIPPASCEGPSFSMPLTGNAPDQRTVPLRMFSTCSGGTATIASTMRTLSLLGLLTTFAWLMARAMAWALGFDLPGWIRNVGDAPGEGGVPK